MSGAALSSSKQDIVAPFASGPFEPHGQIEHWLEGNVLCFEAAGPFNKEAVEALVRSRADWLPAYALKGHFANLAVFRESVLITPEAFDEFRSYVAGYTSSATAFVIGDDIEGAGTMVPLFKRLFESVGHPFGVFADRASAEAWLRGVLAALPPATP